MSGCSVFHLAFGFCYFDGIQIFCSMLPHLLVRKTKATTRFRIWSLQTEKEKFLSHFRSDCFSSKLLSARSKLEKQTWFSGMLVILNTNVHIALHRFYDWKPFKVLTRCITQTRRRKNVSDFDTLRKGFSLTSRKSLIIATGETTIRLTAQGSNCTHMCVSACENCWETCCVLFCLSVYGGWLLFSP